MNSSSRKHIAIKNLEESDLEAPRKFPRHSKYEVGVAAWNPTSLNRHLCLVASNQRVEVVAWGPATLAQTHSLRAHTRSVADAEWHRTDAHVLASCSADAFIHVWDIREPRRPALSLSAVAPATQVRWNGRDAALLATAHDGDVKLWDERKGTAPVHYIAAHLAPIHGLRWCPTRPDELATASHDGTVKLFDVGAGSTRRPHAVVSTGAPVWRVRYTPFGRGLVTVVLPQLRRGAGAENGLLMWSLAEAPSPVHTFVGHSDVVLEFDWRPRPGIGDHQLITWSKDQTLRVRFY